jgi:sugar phosphate isomerase/epimerase
MKTHRVNRRQVLKAGLVAAGAVSIRSRASSASAPMRLGGPIFARSDDPAVLAQAHRDLGYRAAYAPEVKLDEREKIAAIRREFAARDVVIAEVGAWVNLLDPDSEKRRANVAYVTERLALAEALEARCCVDIAGSFNPDIWYGPHPGNFSRDFFDASVETARRIIDAVKPTRTRFTYEMMGWALPSGPEEYLEMIEAIDRPSFAVHLDVCNAVNSPGRIYRNSELIDACFEVLGPWIVSCHAKDVAWVPGMQVHFREVIPGRGEIDYRAHLRGLARLPVDAPLMLEHLETAEEYAEGAHHIRSVAAEMGLSFEGGELGVRS